MRRERQRERERERGLKWRYPNNDRPTSPQAKHQTKILNPRQSKVPSVSCHSSLAFLLRVSVPKSLESLGIRTNLVYFPQSIAPAILFASSRSLSLSLYSQKVKLKTKIGKIKFFFGDFQ